MKFLKTNDELILEASSYLKDRPTTIQEIYTYWLAAQFYTKKKSEALLISGLYKLDIEDKKVMFFIKNIDKFFEKIVEESEYITRVRKTKSVDVNYNKSMKKYVVYERDDTDMIIYETIFQSKYDYKVGNMNLPKGYMYDTGTSLKISNENIYRHCLSWLHDAADFQTKHGIFSNKKYKDFLGSTSFRKFILTSSEAKLEDFYVNYIMKYDSGLIELYSLMLPEAKRKKYTAEIRAMKLNLFD